MQKVTRLIRRAGSVAAIAAAATSCTLFPIDIAVTAEATDGSATSGYSGQTIDLGNDIIVTNYEVTFYRIEIGNSEEDKFTLWEDSDGVTQDLVAAVTFADVLPATWGTYQFLRLTIDEDIELTGTVSGTGATATLTVTGHSQDAAGHPRFLFGTDEVNETGKFLLASPVEIRSGGSLTMQFNLDDTVDAGPPLTVSAPVITLEITS